MNIEEKDYSITTHWMYPSEEDGTNNAEGWALYYYYIEEKALRFLNLTQTVFNYTIKQKIYSEFTDPFNQHYKILSKVEVYLPQFPEVTFICDLDGLDIHEKSINEQNDYIFGGVSLSLGAYKSTYTTEGYIDTTTHLYRIATMIDIEGNPHYFDISVKQSGQYVYTYSYGFINLYDLESHVHQELALCNHWKIYRIGKPFVSLHNTMTCSHVFTNRLFTIPENEVIFNNAYIMKYFLYTKSFCTITVCSYEQLLESSICKLTDKNNKSTYVFIADIVLNTDNKQYNAVAIRLAIEDEKDTSSPTT